MVLRYALAQNAFQKYVATTIAKDVSDETVAVIKEHTDELQGVEIAEDTKRVYYDAESFSNIIGYTGTISSDEYDFASFAAWSAAIHASIISWISPFMILSSL